MNVKELIYVNNTETKDNLSVQAAAEAEFCESQKEAASQKTPKNFPKKKRSVPFAVFLPVVSILLIISILFASTSVVMTVLYFTKSEGRKAVYNSKSDLDIADSGSDRIPLYNYALGDISIPAADGVPKSQYREENFTFDENGFMHYVEDGEVLSYTGVDVSSFNGEIDWERVKAAGVDFAMLRIGGRGYGEEGVLYKDDAFEANLKGAKRAGLKVGAYFFSQARTEEEAVEEAEFALGILAGEKLHYPLAFDWEIIDSVETRIDDVDTETLTKCARAFCDTVKAEGYTPQIYTGSNLAYFKYDLTALRDIDLWYAFYNDSPSMYYKYTMWQYSCEGQVDGIYGDVDLNVCMKNYD